MDNGSIGAFNCSRQYQPMPKESIDANYQVVKVSFAQTLLRHDIKRRSLTVRVRRISALARDITQKLQRRKFAKWNFSVLC